MNLLEGVRVLDLTRLTPGAYASLLLADLGADVVKIEEPARGDYMRDIIPSGYEVLNRNKRSVTVDLRTPEGRESLLRLSAKSDVVLENFRPGVVDRLGVGYEVLKSVSPGLIYCAMSGYGQTGPYRDLSGHDLNYLGVTGAWSLLGGRDCTAGMAVGDLSTAMICALSVVAALFDRARSGRGQYIDVSMTDVMASLAARYIAEHEATGSPSVERGGYGYFEAADGVLISVGCIEDRFWLRLLDQIDRSDDIHKHGSRQAAPKEINASLARVLRSRESAYWIGLGREHDIPLGPVLELDEVRADPHVIARELFRPVRSGDGRAIAHVRFPALFSDAGEHAFRPAPFLGQHTAEVLSEAERSGERRDDEGQSQAVIRPPRTAP